MEKYLKLSDVKQLLQAFNFEEMPMSPVILSNDLDQHDCDSCEASPSNVELFDENTCKRCWANALEKSAIECKVL